MIVIISPIEDTLVTKGQKVKLTKIRKRKAWLYRSTRSWSLFTIKKPL